MQTAMIPQWTHDDFEGLAPYEWLAQYRDNKFQLEQQVARVQKAAAAVGFRRFMSVWRGYLKSLGEVGRATSAARATEFTGQEAELLCGAYTCTDEGVTIESYGGFEQVVISHPIMPVKRLVNIDTNEERMQLAYRRGRAWKKIVVPKMTLASAQKIVGLSTAGIGVTSENARSLVSFLSELEAWNYDAIPEQASVGRLGWLEDGTFSPYCDDVEYDGESADFRRIFEAFHSHGSREEWMQMAREIRAGDSVPARIALAAAFAAPLVQPLSALPFFVHFWGDPGCGKTVALHVAASVWAEPVKSGYIKTFNSTTVGHELYAEFCRNVPVLLDELQLQGDKKIFDNTIYMLCEGIGKSRGTKEGGLRAQGRWSTCMLSTGEQPIVQSNSGGGAAARVIEVNFGGQPFYRDAREVADICHKNYGFAGREFVEALSDPDVMKQLRVVQKALYDELEKNIQEKQTLAASILLTADFFADVLLFKDGCALTAPEISPYLVTSDQADAQARCYEYLMGAVAENQSAFICHEKSGTVIYPANKTLGIIDQRINSGAIYIIRSAFDRMLQEGGFSPGAFLSWAKRKGMLIADRQGGKNERCTCRKMINKTRVICIGIKTDDFEMVDAEDEVTFDEG